MEKIILKKNEIYESEITGYTAEGLGVCRINGAAVFVPHAVRGEIIKVRITKVSSSYCYGRVEEIISPSPSRIEPECPYFKGCGGCALLHMSYAEELNLKLENLNQCLRHIGGASLNAEEIIGCDNIYNYRNKVTYFVSGSAGSAYFGLYAARSHNVIDISDCLIQNPLAQKAADAVIEFINDRRIPPYDESTGRGCIRYINFRGSYHLEGSVLCITAAKGLGAYTSAFVNHIVSRCPFITGIVLNINKKPGNELLTGDFYTLYGQSELSDTLCGCSFKISPRSFYQVNPLQAEKLYAKALEFISSGKCDNVLELYCGIGTISHLLSAKFKNVIGVEIVPEAIENAVLNAKSNNISNIEFICADASDALKILSEREIVPDAVLVDPPRKGMLPDAIDYVCKMAPERIVYVSCNPSTLARDIKIFTEKGYALSRITAVDMFPRTHHCEVVALLSKVVNGDGSH